jgi:hypothetical protein
MTKKNENFPVEIPRIFGALTSQKFGLKNMISTYTKDFPWKKWLLNSPDF